MLRDIVTATLPNPSFDAVAGILADAIRHRRATFLSGAGVSRPSGLPLARELVSGVVEAMCESLRIADIANGDEASAIEAVLRSYPLERLLDSLDGLQDDAVLEYLGVLNRAEPNLNHRALASFATRGYLTQIVTLNFDVLFENALIRKGAGVAWELPLAGVKRVVAEGSPRVTVTKLHGSLELTEAQYEPYYLAPTLRYAGDRPQEENRKAMRAAMERGSVLVVAGYSNNDWDITPLLTELPWAEVYWCQYSSSRPTDRIWKWLTARDSPHAYLITGDVRTLLVSVIDHLDVSMDHSSELNHDGTWRQVRSRMPDPSPFLRHPLRTSFAAIRLLDGKANRLFSQLLPRFGARPGVAEDRRLKAAWIDAMGWYEHAHRRNVRSAIKLRWKARRLRPAGRSLRDRVECLGEVLALYYEHLSALKRPYLNVLWPWDAAAVLWLRRTLRRGIRRARVEGSLNPWAEKEVRQYTALADYYLVDLLHNWGYHLLPLGGEWLRRLTRGVFRRIASLYRRVLDRFGSLEWEYHYVRSVEASLIGREELDWASIERKLLEIEEMFARTGLEGHHAYLRSVLAILRRDSDAYREATSQLADPESLATPSGTMRAILLQRYFWPETMGAARALQALWRYSRRQPPGELEVPGGVSS